MTVLVTAAFLRPARRTIARTPAGSPYMSSKRLREHLGGSSPAPLARRFACVIAPWLIRCARLSGSLNRPRSTVCW